MEDYIEVWQNGKNSPHREGTSLRLKSIHSTQDVATKKAQRIFTYGIPSNSQGTEYVSISLGEPMLLAENLGLQTWISSVILAERLAQLDISWPYKDNINDFDVLELGAGTGLVGLSAAAIWKRSVMLTDLTPIVPGLAANIALNNEITPSVNCGMLDWSNPEHLKDSAGQEVTRTPSTSVKPLVILAADTVYSEDHPELITRTVSAWLNRDKDARLVLAYALRIAYLDIIRELWSRLEDMGLKALHEEQTHVAGDLDDQIEYCVWAWK